jgi:hypothetical protein
MKASYGENNSQRGGRKHRKSLETHSPTNPFPMPKDPKGMAGLAQLLNHCLYKKIIEDQKNGVDTENQPQDGKMTRVTKKL